MAARSEPGIGVDSGLPGPVHDSAYERSSITNNKSISTVDDGFGGGICFGASDDATDLVIDRSTISGNTAGGAGRGYGAGIFFSPILSCAAAR